MPFPRADELRPLQEVAVPGQGPRALVRYYCPFAACTHRSYKANQALYHLRRGHAQQLPENFVELSQNPPHAPGQIKFEAVAGLLHR